MYISKEYLAKKEELPQRVNGFLTELETISKKYNLSISIPITNEGEELGIVIENFSQRNIDWLFDGNLELYIE